MIVEDIRHGRYWLLAALIGSIAPLWDRLPLWLSLLLLTSCFWRLPAVEIRIKPPGFWLRVMILIAGAVGLWKYFNTLFGPEAGSASLVLCMALKLLEMRNRRDCYVTIILCFFVVATNFLFTQSLAVASYIGVVLIVICGALLVMHEPADRSSWKTARKALVLVAQAGPLMLILFLFFPRLPPLWTLHLTQGASRTGISDTMSPGDIAKLSQSDELAFRVEFHGPIPEKSQLYWRGLILSRFDGLTWTPDPRNGEGNMVAWANRHWPDWVYGIQVDKRRAISYRIILEPTDQPWLFALSVPYTETAEVGFTREFNLVSSEPVYSRKTYDVTSFAPQALDATLPDEMRAETLELPGNDNPKTRAQAKRWRASVADDAAYVRLVLNWLHHEPFFYTLEPPTLSGDRVDEFLFSTRKGFCEHYASSFAFLMRAAGIPARVVAGYQGGDLSPYGDYWQVRQLDAHAWTEVWLPGRGWTQVDPTASVAPERIQHGMSALAEQRSIWGNSGASGLRYSNFKLLSGLRQWVDYVNYRWYTDVLGYDTHSQDGLMQRLLGDASYMQRALVMAGLFVSVLGLMVLIWYWRQPRRVESAADRYYRFYCRRLAAAGLPRAAGEGASDFAARVAVARPRLAASVAEVTRLYVHLSYMPANAHDRDAQRRLRKLSFLAPVKA